MDITYSKRTRGTVTFDREALTLMLLQLTDPNVEPPTLQVFLQRVKDEIPMESSCAECQRIRELIRSKKR